MIGGTSGFSFLNKNTMLWVNFCAITLHSLHTAYNLTNSTLCFVSKDLQALVNNFTKWYQQPSGNLLFLRMISVMGFFCCSVQLEKFLQ